MASTVSMHYRATNLKTAFHLCLKRGGLSPKSWVEARPSRTALIPEFVFLFSRIV